MQEKKNRTIEKETKETLGVLETKRERRGPAERMWAPLKLKLDDDYDYVTKNFGLRFLRYIAVIFGLPFVYLYYKIKWDFKILHKENAKMVKNRSAVMVANHVHNVDAFMATRVFYPDTPYIVALKHNFEAFLLGGLVRVMRGVPLPSKMRHFERFTNQLSTVLQDTKHKVLIFPEGEIEPFGKRLRSFKSGAFHLAVKNNAPILPMVFVFSPERKVRLIIGKPLYIEDVPGTADMKQPIQVRMLCEYTKEEMQKMLITYYGVEEYDNEEENS